MKHIFLKQYKRTLNTIFLQDAETIHYVLHVLRKKENDPLFVYDHHKLKAEVTIRFIDSDKVELEITKEIQFEPSLFKLSLYQTFLKSNDKMEWILQKAVELGISKITPVNSRYSETRLSPERWLSKKTRWEKIISNACNQSKQISIPILENAIDFKDIILQTKLQTVLFLNPISTNSLKEVITKLDWSNLTELAIVIGPEGGWHDEEIALSKANNIYHITLGNLILRAETAAIYMMSVCQYEIIDKKPPSVSDTKGF